MNGDGGALVVLGFGSNMGNSLEILRSAVEDTEKILTDIRVSSLYQTDPQDFTEQPSFLNVVVAGWYHGSADTLYHALAAIETRYERDRSSSRILKGPRTLDIDIELFGGQVIKTRDLIIPHERMNCRQFVLVPLIELLPDCADPVTGELYRLISARLPDQGVIKAGDLYGN